LVTRVITKKNGWNDRQDTWKGEPRGDIRTLRPGSNKSLKERAFSRDRVEAERGELKGRLDGGEKKVAGDHTRLRYLHP